MKHALPTALRWRLVLAGLCLGMACGASANEARALSGDVALDARTKAIADELRCLVCQNETVADSHADLAVDLRRQIREQLTQGRSPAEISNYMVARYGAFVRYRPAFDTTTLVLWLGPFALLAAGGVGVLLHIRHRRADAPMPATADGFTDAERARLRELGVGTVMASVAAPMAAPTGIAR